MDIGKSFTYMFEDPDWLRKLGIATAVALAGLVLMFILIGFIPLIILMGYTLEVVSNVLSGAARPLPEWDSWERFLRRGWKLFVVMLVWALPALIVVIPLSIFGALLSNGSEGARTVGSLISVCGSCLATLWGIVVAVFTPAIYVRVAETDSISAGFNFAQVWAFTRNNVANVIVALLLTLVAYIIGSIVAPLGVIAIIIGLLITVPFCLMVWPMLVEAHLFGQVGRRSTSVEQP